MGSLGLLGTGEPARKVPEGGDMELMERELGKCQNEISQFPFFPLTPHGYSWPVCPPVLTRRRWLRTGWQC